MKHYALFIILLSILSLANAQFGSFYKYLLDDDSLFNTKDEPQRPKAKEVSRVTHESEPPSSKESLDRTEKMVGSLEDVFSKTESLFSRVFGVLGDKLSDRMGKSAHSMFDGSHGRQVGLKPENSDSSDEDGIGSVGKVFDLLGSLGGSLPFSGSGSGAQIRGEHVCVREIQSVLEPSNRTRISKTCQQFKTAHKCVDRKETHNGGRETVRISECCDGFDSDNIFRNGCNKELDITNFEDTLVNFNNTAASVYQKAGLDHLLTDKGPFTFLVPNQKALDELTDPALLKNTVVSGIYRDYDLSSGDVLSTIDMGTMNVQQKEDTPDLQTLINCVPISRANIRVKNGLVHLMDGIVAPAADNLLELLTKDGRFTTFLSLLNDSLRDRLSSTSSHHTVFPFTDEVFKNLSSNIQEQVTKKSGCIKDIAKNHIVRSSMCLSSLDDKTLVTLGAQVLRTEKVNSKGFTVRIGTTKVIQGNLVAANGVAHVVDDIIAAEELLTWKDHLAPLNPPLYAALQDLNLQEPITIFMPPVNLTDNSTQFAENHVLPGSLFKGSSEGTTLTMLGKNEFFAGRFVHSSPISIRVSIGSDTAKRDAVQIGCNRIVGEPMKSCNALIYTIDKPLPSSTETLKEFLESRTDLSKFKDLLLKSNASNILEKSCPITLFIPSDDAFSNNELKRLMKNETRLNAFVKRYIVEEPLCKHNLEHQPREYRMEMYRNMAGESLTTSGAGQELAIEGARVQESEIVLSNGVVYILETTIQKPIKTAEQVPAGASRFATSLFDILGHR